jgi:hypothetical protein
VSIAVPAELRVEAGRSNLILATWLGTGASAAHALLKDLMMDRGEEGLADFLLLAGHLACQMEVGLFEIWTPEDASPGTGEVVLATAEAFAGYVCDERYDLARAVLAPLFAHPHWGMSFTVTVVRGITDHRPGELRTYLAEQGIEIM